MSPSRRAREALRPAAIVIAVAVAYLPALHAGFVFDDHELVEGRLMAGPLWRFWASTKAPDYWPVTWTLLWIERRLWGTDPFPYHAVNVGLHATVAVLLAYVLRRLRVRGAWLAGLLFAVHPVAVESVAWISECKNETSLLLLLAAALAWLRFDDERHHRDYLLALVLFALAGLAKGSIVMFPIVLGGIAYRRRACLDSRDLKAIAPFLALALALGLVNLWFQWHNAMAIGYLPPRGLLERIGGVGWALAFYVRTAFLPASLGFVHARWSARSTSPLFFAPLVVVALAFVCLGVAGRKHKWARATYDALAFHAVMLLPVLGLVDIAYFRVSPVSDHLQYSALIGPVALLGASAAEVATHSRLAALAWAAVLAFGAATFQRTADFHDDAALWTAAVRDAPGNAFAHYQLGAVLASRGLQAASQRELELAAAAESDAPIRHVYRAVFLISAGRRSEAAAEARAALASARDAETRRDAARVLIRAGESAEAAAVLADLTKMMPDSSDYAYWLANALWHGGRVDAALKVLRQFCRAHADDAEMQKALGIVLVRAGHSDEARRHAADVARVPVDDPRVETILADWSTGE